MPASTRVRSLTGLAEGQGREQGGPVGPRGIHALDVREDDELARSECGGESGGGGVGVDVEDLSRVVEVGCDSGHDGDPARVEQVDDGLGVDRDDVADETEVLLDVVDDDPTAACAEQGCVLPRQADGERTVLVEQADEPHAPPDR